MQLNTKTLVNELPRLLERLRRDNYVIGSDTYIQAYSVIMSRAIHGSLPHHQWDSHELDWLRMSLGPIFCQTPDQQQRFNDHFSNWIQSKKDQPETPHAPVTHKVKHRVRLYKSLGIGFLIAVAILIGWEIWSWVGSTSTANPTEVPSSVAYTDLTLYLIAILALMSLMFMFSSRIVRDRAVDSHVINFNLRKKKLAHDAPRPLREAAQQLRRHELVAWERLDVQRSINRTIENAGFFSPEYGSRPQLPEFIVLIESRSTRDHQTAAATVWVDMLIRQGLVITCFRYRNAPWEYMVDDSGTRVSWDQLQSRYSQHRLLVLGDALQWFDTLESEPASQAIQLSHWPLAIMLTPRPLDEWDHREWKLNQLGLIPFRQNSEGLAQLARWLQQPDHPLKYTQDFGYRPPPRLLVREDLLQKSTLHTKQMTQIIEALKDYLGTQQFLVLCSCAVYPELHFSITMQLVHVLTDLDPNNVGDFQKLSPLLRITWFRNGSIPDSFRIALLRQLKGRQIRDVRRILYHLLVIVQDHSKSDTISIHDRTPGLTLKNKIRHWLDSASQPAVHRDYIFAKTMKGFRPKHLSLTLPGRLKRYRVFLFLFLPLAIGLLLTLYDIWTAGVSTPTQGMPTDTLQETLNPAPESPPAPPKAPTIIETQTTQQAPTQKPETTEDNTAPPASTQIQDAPTRTQPEVLRPSSQQQPAPPKAPTIIDTQNTQQYPAQESETKEGNTSSEETPSRDLAPPNPPTLLR